MDRQPRRRRSYRYRRKRRIRLLVLLLGLAAAIVGLVKLISYGVDLLSSRQTAQNLREVYYADLTTDPIPATETLIPTSAPTPEETATVTPGITASPVQEAAPTAAAQLSQVQSMRLSSVRYPDNPGLKISNRFRTLRKESKYIVGWLSIHHLLDEAVVQRDNVYYLDHDALGRQNVNGALFLDSAIGLKTRPYTYIIYGHNMKSGAMFGCLRNYENSTYYHNDPFLTFDTMYETGRYVVFAAGSVSTEEGGSHYVDFYALRSASIPERKGAIDALVAASVHTCTIDVRAEDQLLVLVTCVDRDEDRRVVVARRIREDEKEEDLKKQAEKSRKK